MRLGEVSCGGRGPPTRWPAGAGGGPALIGGSPYAHAGVSVDGACARTKAADPTAATSARTRPSAFRIRERLQQLGQPRITGAADGEARAVAQNRHAAVLRVQLDACDP